MGTLSIGQAGCTRRCFLAALSGGALFPIFPSGAATFDSTAPLRIRPTGPGTRYTPRIRAAFVRRRGEYGMLWPGAVYDGETAQRNYHDELRTAEKDLGLEIDLRTDPIHSLKEAEAWLAEAGVARPDGLLVILLDRQEHSWPTANLAIDTGLPTIIFSPIGTSFTTNTTSPSQKPHNFIASTSEFAQARYGLKMIRAAAKLREMRYLVLKGGGENGYSTCVLRHSASSLTCGLLSRGVRTAGNHG